MSNQYFNHDRALRVLYALIQPIKIVALIKFALA